VYHANTHDTLHICLRPCKFVISMMVCTRRWYDEPVKMGSRSLSCYVVKPLGWRLDHRSRNGYDEPVDALLGSRPPRS
jgi:hypothetical protein